MIRVHLSTETREAVQAQRRDPTLSPAERDWVEAVLTPRDDDSSDVRWALETALAMREASLRTGMMIEITTMPRR